MTQDCPRAIKELIRRTFESSVDEEETHRTQEVLGEELMPVIWGHVQAVTIGGTSLRIVVTPVPGSQETIDAHVGRNTLIARGIHTVSLNDIKAGELVELSYIKIGERTEACMVYLRTQELRMRA